MYHARQTATRKSSSIPRSPEQLRSCIASNDRYLAVTSIEHAAEIITIVSGRMSIDIVPESESISVSFLTKIYGGPLDGKTWLSNSSRTALANHSIAMTETTEAVAPDGNEVS